MPTVIDKDWRTQKIAKGAKDAPDHFVDILLDFRD